MPLAEAQAVAFIEPLLITAIAHFFLACVSVAGLYGAATAGRGILFVQAVPGILALAAVLAQV